MDKRSEKKLGMATAKILTLVSLLLISAFVFGVLAHEVVVEGEDWFDSSVFTFFKPYSSPEWIYLFKLVTFLGATFFLIPAWIILIAILLVKRNRREAVAVLILAISSTLLLYGLKIAFARRRPALPLTTPLSDYSFPSGHAFSSLVFFGAVIWLTWQSATRRKWKWMLSIALLILVFLIGVSRIVLRYHYASDVVAGFSLGLAYVLLFLGLKEKWILIGRRRSRLVDNSFKAKQL